MTSVRRALPFPSAKQLFDVSASFVTVGRLRPAVVVVSETSLLETRTGKSSAKFRKLTATRSSRMARNSRVYFADFDDSFANSIRADGRNGYARDCNSRRYRFKSGSALQYLAASGASAFPKRAHAIRAHIGVTIHQFAFPESPQGGLIRDLALRLTVRSRTTESSFGRRAFREREYRGEAALS
jgi:hypothetical protein